MTASTKRHNPQLEQRLQSFLSIKDTKALCIFLETLSNADFRTASYLLGEKLLTKISDNTFFWECFNSLSLDNPKAYLGTCLKATKLLLKNNKISISYSNLSHIASNASLIDKRKILSELLPYLKSLEDIRILLELFCDNKPEARIACLLSCKTDYSYFWLFQQFRLIEDEPQKLKSYCIQLMKHEEKKSYNLAILTQLYFGLEALPGTFSLQIEHYQLNQLENSFDAFQRILNS